MTNLRIALITGASRGLGLEAGKQLATKGGHLVLLGSRDSAKTNEAIEAFRADATAAAKFLEAEKAAGCPLLKPLTIDPTQGESIAAAVEQVEKEYGRLDILVNNAGFMDKVDDDPTKVPMDLLKHTFNINFFSLVDVTCQFMPLLRKAQPAALGGRIVNVSSCLGSIAQQSQSNYLHVSYDASKAAVNMYTVELAQQLKLEYEAAKKSVGAEAAVPVVVNAAHPGWVQTDMGGKQADLKLEDGVDTVMDFVLQPEGQTTNGAFMHKGVKLPW